VRKLFELVGTGGGPSVQPVLLAHADGAGAQEPRRSNSAVALHREKCHRSANSRQVPVLLDGDKAVADSWEIANYLEDIYPTGRRCLAATVPDDGTHAELVERRGDRRRNLSADRGGYSWPPAAGSIRPTSATTREARLGRTLEEAAATRDKASRRFAVARSDAAELRTHPLSAGRPRTMPIIPYSAVSSGRGRPVRSNC